MSGITSAPSSQGIERAPLDAQPTLKSGNAHDHLEGKVKAPTRAYDTSYHIMQPSPKSGFRRISKSIKAKIHRRSHTHPDVSTDQRTLDKAVLAPTLSPNPTVATKEDRFDGEPPAKPSLPPVKDFLCSPIQTVKAVAHISGGGAVVEQIATKDVGHEAGVNLVRAEEDLADAKTKQEKTLALEKLATLRSVRQDSYVRWTLDRHIAKIGRYQPHPLTRKARHDFAQQRGNGKRETEWRSYGHYVRSQLFLHLSPAICCSMAKSPKILTESTFQQFEFYLQKYGGRYIGASDELPEPTEDALISSFERILLTSTPIQDAFMTLRRVSNWENPWQSAPYMVIYFVFLFYSYITRAFVSRSLCLWRAASFYPMLTFS